MSLYVIVEGRRTEPKIYDAWLPFMFPGIERVKRIEDTGLNTYFLIGGHGYPSYIDRIRDAIEDIRDSGRFTHLVVCVDAEEMAVDEKLEEIAAIIRDCACPVPHSTIVANCCVETWLLGNRKVVSRNPQSERLRLLQHHHDVVTLDPEDMPAHADFGNRAATALAYVKEVFRERKLSYTKRNPGHALQQEYFEQLRLRAEAGHITSFAALLRLPSRVAST